MQVLLISTFITTCQSLSISNNWQGLVPVNKESLTGTVPVNKVLLTGTVPVNNLFLKGIQWKTNFGDPPYPPKKADFGRTKAEMGYFSQKGLCYSFGILHGLLSNKNIRISMGKNFGPPPPSPLKKPIWGGQKPKWAQTWKKLGS